MAEWAADQLIQMLLHGTAPTRMVNPEVWPQVQRKLADKHRA
jgi:hypothetical protein